MIAFSEPSLAAVNREAGYQLRCLRRSRGLTQIQVGALLWPPRSGAAVSDIERGVTLVTVELLAQFARVLRAQIRVTFDAEREEVVRFPGRRAPDTTE